MEWLFEVLKAQYLAIGLSLQCAICMAKLAVYRTGC